MRITIDTQHDSGENIRKAIRILQEIVGDNVVTNSPELVNKEDSSAFVNIFGDDSPASAEKTEGSGGVEGSGEVFTSIFGEDTTTKTAETARSEKKDEGKDKEEFGGDMIEFY